ncbi:hypothetical protein LCGC14_2408570 [marine sediment metagenome]|uniref:Uncharacterized protein n=1 Tax=marine sediment metagenome TaxID=412755 RepID=A0A0F9BT93_9ZZZZ
MKNYEKNLLKLLTGRKRKGYIVLCLNPGVFSPFVTWWMGADIGDCSHGNYFVDLTEAVKDFNERT